MVTFWRLASQVFHFISNQLLPFPAFWLSDTTKWKMNLFAVVLCVRWRKDPYQVAPTCYLFWILQLSEWLNQGSLDSLQSVSSAHSSVKLDLCVRSAGINLTFRKKERKYVAIRTIPLTQWCGCSENHTNEIQSSWDWVAWSTHSTKAHADVFILFTRLSISYKRCG